MDGTIANLYGVENWLSELRAESTKPYAEAKPLLNMSALARVLNKLTAKGYEIGIISWTSKGGSEQYNKAVAETKIKWLSKHLASVHFTSINVVPYGTPKQTIGNGILFDDEEPNRTNWNGIAYSEKEIMRVLKTLI